MYVHGIIHLGALRDLPVCVSILCQVYGIRCQGAIQVRTEGVRNCCLELGGPHGVVKCHTRSRIRTPNLQGITGPPKMCKQTVAAVQRMRLVSRTDPNRGCMKLLFGVAWSKWSTEVP